MALHLSIVFGRVGISDLAIIVALWLRILWHVERALALESFFVGWIYRWL